MSIQLWPVRCSELIGPRRNSTGGVRNAEKSVFYKINDTKSWRLTFKRNSFLTIFYGLSLLLVNCVSGEMFLGTSVVREALDGKNFGLKFWDARNQKIKFKIRARF